MDTVSSNNKTQPTEGKEMSLAHAYEFPWPVNNERHRRDNNFGEPIGKRLDAGKLTWSDLGYLAQRGYTPREREVGKKVLLDQLQNSVETSEVIEPPRVISPKNWTYTERRQHQLTMLAGLLLGLLIGSSVTFEIHNLINGSFARGLNQITNLHSLQQLRPTAIFLTLGIVLFIVFLKFFGRLIDKINDEVENCRKGRIGEDLTARIIEQTLDKKWSVYLNLLLPEKRGADMDVVLVGPQGIWVLEVKNLKGQFRNTGEQWEILQGTDWKLRRSPTKQVRKNAARLCSYLKAQDIDKAYTETAIIWVNIEKKPKIQNCMASVWPLDTLREELMLIAQKKTKLSPEEQRGITDKLDSLYKGRDEQAPHAN
jgi:Nuclease-related domain